MNLHKGLSLVALIVLSGCVSLKKNNDDEQETKLSSPEVPSMYNLPSVVDYEKAARLNVELGMSYLKQDNYPRAKSKLLRALDLGPNLPEVQYAYAYYLEKVGELVEAEKKYVKAIRLEPQNGKSHNNYGAFLCRQGRYDEAEKSFLSALNDPNYSKTAEVLENAGLCVMQIPAISKAEQYFERALKHDPKRYHAMLELAIIKYKKGEYSQAQGYYATYSKLAAPTKRSLLLGLQLAEISGDKDKQASIKLMLNARYPNSPQKF